jgi:hypothetical protein
MSYGQGAFLEENFMGHYPAATHQDLLVAHVKWLMGGQSTGLVLVSDVHVDLSFFDEDAVSVIEVGTTAREALTDAGFTISASSDDEQKITYPEFDVAIIGIDHTFATDLTNNDKQDMLYDFIFAGGALITTSISQPYMTNRFYTKVPISLGHSTPSVNPGEDFVSLTDATAKNATIFPPGMSMHRKLSGWVNLNDIFEDANHQLYPADDGFGPVHTNRFATFSGHGDA